MKRYIFDEVATREEATISREHLVSQYRYCYWPLYDAVMVCSERVGSSSVTWLKLTVLEVCTRCKKNAKAAEHACPYQSDVNDDHETLCTCCGDCAHECAMDI